MFIRKKTTEVRVGNVIIGGEHPIVVQSMCATPTSNIKQTIEQIYMLKNAGAEIIRLAADTEKDVDALKNIRLETEANLSVDLQENYKLAKDVAPYVQKIRYNPGHLHHHEKTTSVVDKVRFIVDAAKENDCAIRIGVNSGSIDPMLKNIQSSSVPPALQSAIEHTEYMRDLGFSRFVVSIKSSDPKTVVRLNSMYRELYPDVPIHLGVTEAGMLPEAEYLTREAFEPLLSAAIGETLRVSLTVPYNNKFKEVEIGKKIIEDVNAGKAKSFAFSFSTVKIISCPSCSRVENLAFVDLAYKVKQALTKFEGKSFSVAIMGCRVNGPGETDEADFGLWCGASFVNLKKGKDLLGRFSYDEVEEKLLVEVEKLMNNPN